MVGCDRVVAWLVSIAESASELLEEGVDPYGFYGQARCVMPAQFAPALSFSKIDPVRCLVAGPREARDLDKGLKKHRTISIACLPILGQPAGCHGQEAGSQILALNPRQYQEAGVVYHQVQISLTLCGGPADETIPGSYFPGCGPEPHQSERP